MTQVVTQRTLLNGTKKYICMYTVITTVTGTELTLQRVNTTNGDLPSTAKLVRIWAQTNTPIATLFWEATTNVPFWMVPAFNLPTEISFKDFGGISNNGAAGVTGNILITTIGLTSTVGNSMSLILEFDKI